MESLIGTTIGGFKLSQSIGSGTTGQVFEGADPTGARAAIKVLHPGLSLFTKVQSYWDELQLLAELSHPHMTIPTSADWSTSGRFYLAMDLLTGLDLSRTLKQHARLSASQVLLFAGQTCLALEAIHELNLCHGALKPSNIFLLPRGGEPTRFSTRVTDFSTLHLVDASKATQGIQPAYLAPEQFRGQASPVSDIYALGVLLCEALGGERPFAGESFEELTRQHAKQPPRIPAGVPRGLVPILTKALAREPAQRHESITALREALESWASSKPAELDQAETPLFPKDPDAAGVGSEGPQTLRVSLEEISAIFDDDTPLRVRDSKKEPSKVEDKTQSAPTADETERPSEAKAKSVPQDDELAAIAEKAGAALRKDRPEPREEPISTIVPQQEIEGFFDEDGDMVELPLERSVRAFVANISPTVPAGNIGHGGNGHGESLDQALDAFVEDARAWSAALPPPVVDDRALAELARVPEPEPEPEPEPKPAPVPAPVPIATTSFIEPPPPPRSVALPVILAFVIGGGLVFGGMKIFAPTPPPVDPNAGTSKIDDNAGGAVATPAPDRGTTALAAPLPDAAPVAITDGAATASLDAAATATTTPDAAAPTPKVVKVHRPRPKIRRPRPKIRRPEPRPEPKTKAKAQPKSQPKPKAQPKAQPQSKSKSKKGDWVDPFSQ